MGRRCVMHQVRIITALMCLTVFFINHVWAEKLKLVIPKNFPCETLLDEVIKGQCLEIQAKQKKQSDKETTVFLMGDCSLLHDSDRQICELRNLEISKQYAESLKNDRFKNADSIERKILLRLEKEEKRIQKEERDLRGAYIRAQVQGCEPGTVKIFPGAAEDPTGWGVVTWIHSTLVVVNKGPYLVESIIMGNEKIVQNLCSGGSLVITTRLRVYRDGATPLQYTAVGRAGGGTVGISTYQGGFLQPCWGQPPCQIARVLPPWEIVLR